MDRNLSIAVQNQPSSAVDVRLYVKASEFLALKNASNSLGQPSGISTISDVSVFKNEQNCSGSITLNATRLTTASSLYEYGYVLSASVNSFSTFYFAKSTLAVLPVSLTSFDAVKQDNSVKLDWVTENESNTSKFEVERSTNATDFVAITTVAAKGGTTSATGYTVNDDHPVNGINYYRLKPVDKNGQFRYSNIIKVDFTKKYTVNISPNPAHDYMVISGAGVFKQIQVLDAAGKMIKQMNRQSNNRYSLAGLGTGIYFIRLVGANDTTTVKLVIE
jgi:hypothetical protein